MAITAADHEPMRRAIQASRDALEAGNMPYGATLVSPAGELLWTAQNGEVTSKDCTRHAELALVRDATARLGAAAVRGGTVYASGEPCAMCAGALFWAGVRRVVYAAAQPVMAAELGGGSLLPIRSEAVYAGADPAVQLDGPLLAEEAVAVLRLARSRRDVAGAPPAA